MATHSSILAWEIPRTEKPGGLQPMGSQRFGHDLMTKNNSNLAACLGDKGTRENFSIVAPPGIIRWLIKEWGNHRGCLSPTQLTLRPSLSLLFPSHPCHPAEHSFLRSHPSFHLSFLAGEPSGKFRFKILFVSRGKLLKLSGQASPLQNEKLSQSTWSPSALTLCHPVISFLLHLGPTAPFSLPRLPVPGSKICPSPSTPITLKPQIVPHQPRQPGGKIGTKRRNEDYPPVQYCHRRSWVSPLQWVLHTHPHSPYTCVLTHPYTCMLILLHIHTMFPLLLVTETNSGTCSGETGRMRMRRGSELGKISQNHRSWTARSWKGHEAARSDRKKQDLARGLFQVLQAGKISLPPLPYFYYWIIAYIKHCIHSKYM